MNDAAAIDITHCRVVAPHRDPDDPDPDLAQEAAEAANEDYVDAWCSGDLYDDGETYSQPIQAMAESHPGLWTQLLETYRHGDHAELESIAGTLARALEEHVKAQGGGMSERRGAVVREIDVIEALRHRPGAATYVVANVLRRSDRYRNVKTSQVLHRLQSMEGRGMVRRITDARNPYARQLMWELGELPK